MNSLVSIIVPCYNQAQFLPEALQSVLEQSYTNWECIIVNDGSPDDTERVAQEWLAKDSRFKYVYKENGGLSSARNAGLENAVGDYIQFLDCDDLIEREKLESSLHLLNSSDDENIKVVISNFRMFKITILDSTNPYCTLDSSKFNFQSLLMDWDDTFTIPIHCGLFQVSLFDTFRFPEHLKSKEDWVMWVSVFQHKCKALFIDKPYAFYRLNPKSMTQTKDMFPDVLKAIGYFKTILTDEELFEFLTHYISRNYKKNNELNRKIKVLKLSNSYQAGLLSKKVLSLLGLLNISKKIFPNILKFKSKLNQ